MNQDEKDNLAILIFSKDRAMQLEANLESLVLHCSEVKETKTFVLYKATEEVYRRQYDVVRRGFGFATFVVEENFRQQVIDIIGNCEHILFLVDDDIFVGNFHLRDILKSLSFNPDAIGFSLRLGKNTTYCYMKRTAQALPSFVAISDNIFKYDWRYAEHDFGYPLEVASSVYRSADILPLISKIDFGKPNMLEGMMAGNAGLYSDARPALLCYGQSVVFCHPINLVQDVSENRVGNNHGYSVEELARMFDDGLRIDVSEFSGFIPQSPHQEADITMHKKENIVENEGPLVSVEMVTYNAEQYIGRAIESVLAQTYRNFELLIVDDGSTDRTRDVVSRYKDSRVRYIHQEHRNAASVRNRAIQEARGEYILCVDSDDFVSVDYLEKMVMCAQKEAAADFYYPSRLTLVDGEGNPSGQSWEYLGFSDNRELPAFLFANGYSPIPNPGSLIRKALFERIGGYEDLDTVEDFVFLCRNALKIRFMRVDEHSDYFYRRINTGLSQRFETRSKITARVLREMVVMYKPEELWPDLSQVKSISLRKQMYYKFLMATFNKHAQTNAERFGYHFSYYSDFFKAELIKHLIRSDSGKGLSSEHGIRSSLADLKAAK
jgi:glycosyltransferase involved in cell wall biosynthesis